MFSPTPRTARICGAPGVHIQWAPATPAGFCHSPGLSPLQVLNLPCRRHSYTLFGKYWVSLVSVSPARGSKPANLAFGVSLSHTHSHTLLWPHTHTHTQYCGPDAKGPVSAACPGPIRACVRMPTTTPTVQPVLVSNMTLLT